MKKVVTTIIAIAALMTVTLCTALYVSADSMYIRKIVSVVYDDSGSMEGDKWAYANYATQVFCGMLNNEDQLFITYMSGTELSAAYQPAEVDLSAENIQASVDSIRNHKDSGSTPYAAVETAYNKLKSVSDSNPNTQYWLVIITDGAFNEHNAESNEVRKQLLNSNFKAYTDSVMPNGTNPQITFLSIAGAVAPDENHGGIYTYSAQSADDIIDAMSEMADRISGRTRLGQEDIEKADDKTIRVSSSIPLLNIAVFNQNSDAKAVKAVYSNESEIPISRTASLNYPGYADLVGGAYLLGDSQKVIGAGTYSITFDRKVDLEDVIILFEPALEMRMTVTVNGREITDYRDLEHVMEGDEVSVSCKIYEMGTDTEIAPDLMPPGTAFEICISEDGRVVEQSSGQDMLLSDYILKNIETEITAAVMIEGFNPIDYSARFTPTKYVPKVVYTLTPSFGGDVKHVRLDDIAENTDMTVCFTVYADGTAVTDPDAVKALNPVISLSPKGNDGTVTYSDDGKIVFTPNAASIPTSAEGSFAVDVTCTLDDGTSATETYSVLLADYQVVSIDATDKVKKTAFYGNQVGVSFYITKDGVRLGQEAVEEQISVVLNEAHGDLKTNAAVASDGMITVTPYSEKEHALTFRSWWTNWAYYFGLAGDDVIVTLNHAYGTADAVIDVIEEDVSYLILHVCLPLLIELTALVLLVTWIVLVVTKPRYLKSATLYVGEIKYNSDRATHTVRNFSAVRLDKFNRVKKGNGRLKFKRTADVVSANGIRIRADHGGRVICEMLFPWYKGRLEPIDTDFASLKTPVEISEYIIKHKKLEVNEFATTETVEGEYNRGLVPANPGMARYIVVPDSGNGVAVTDGKKVIRSGKLFIYING